MYEAKAVKYLNEIINKKKNRSRTSSVFSHDNRDILGPVGIANDFCHNPPLRNHTFLSNF